MNKTVVFYKDGMLPKAFSVTWDEKDYADFFEVETALYAAAQKYANESGLQRVTLSDLPEQIFQACKIKMEADSSVEVSDYPVFRLQRPVEMCGCQYCAHNRNGYCDEHSFSVSDDDEACSRICWTGGKILCYDGSCVGTGFLTEMNDPAEIVRYILNSDDAYYDVEAQSINRIINDLRERGLPYDEKKWELCDDDIF